MNKATGWDTRIELGDDWDTTVEPDGLDADLHNECNLLEGCQDTAVDIIKVWASGESFETLAKVVRDHICMLNQKNLLRYLPTRKRVNMEWIEGSWATS